MSRTGSTPPRSSQPARALSESPIPERWRPLLAQIVHRLVIGDYAGLSRDGFLAYTDDPVHVSIGSEIEGYPAKLVDLPEEAWAFSDHGKIEREANAWWVVLNLWDEGGPSDLSLEAEVRDDGSRIEIKVENVHMM